MRDNFSNYIRQQIYDVLNEETFIGPMAVGALKQDDKYSRLNSIAKKDAENALRKGDSLTLGEMARPTTQGIVFNKNYTNFEKLPKIFQDIYDILKAKGNKPTSLIDLMADLNANKGYNIKSQQNIRMPLKNNYLGPAKAFLLKQIDWTPEDEDEEVSSDDDVTVPTVDGVPSEPNIPDEDEKPTHARNRNIVPDTYKLKSWGDYAKEVPKDDDPRMPSKGSTLPPNAQTIPDEDIKAYFRYSDLKTRLANTKAALRQNTKIGKNGEIGDIKGKPGSETERLNQFADRLKGELKALLASSEYVAKRHKELIQSEKDKLANG